MSREKETVQLDLIKKKMSATVLDESTGKKRGRAGQNGGYGNIS
jgi:hypothetical protein